MNMLRWTLGADRDARRTVPVRSFQPIAAVPRCRSARSRWCPRSTSAAPGSPPPTSATRPLFDYRVPSSLALEVARRLDDGVPFVYAYYDGIDKVAHAYGLGDHYDAELVAVDRIVGRPGRRCSPPAPSSW